jgi:hypothetical protein
MRACAFFRQTDSVRLPRQAIGSSRGGLTNNVNLLNGALGNPKPFVVTWVARNDIRQAQFLVQGGLFAEVACDRS